MSNCPFLQHFFPQFLEGQLIGLSGPQRACSYCALTLRTQIKLEKVSKNSNKLATRSPKEGKNSLGLSANSLEENSEDCSLQQIECGNKGLSDIWSRISQTATLPSVSGAKQLLSAVNLGRTSKQTIETNKSLVNTLESPCDIFPRFVAANSPVSHRKRFTPPSHPSGMRSSWGMNASPLNVNMLGKQLSTFSPSLLQSDLDTDPPDRSSMCTMNKRCDSVGHACTDLDDTQIIALWERTVEPYLNSALENELLVEVENRIDTGSMALSNIHLNTKELQLVIVKHNGRKICCASGLSLVYWIVSTVEEMDHCRWVLKI